jgi:alkanesulfonate monooxygenase SsuD/methylene tetrahydromethanopterin reductase-like flavin-dependent oxidoreductase (luciferase family)
MSSDVLDRSLMLEWARVADEAGFHTLATIDNPNYDSWDPLATLAAVASVTERARLFTNILQLPNRNELLVAQQAATIDVVSGGRLDLGVAVGGRRPDFEVLEARFEDRGRRFEKQVPRIREAWDRARESSRDRGTPGPPPLQQPAPPIWIGGSTEKTIERAVRLGDGFTFGGAGAATVASTTPRIRELAASEGKTGFPVAALQYCVVGEDPGLMQEAAHQLRRYYGQLWAEPEEILAHGPPDAIAESAQAFADGGADVLVLIPEFPDVAQVHALAEILPSFH